MSTVNTKWHDNIMGMLVHNKYVLRKELKNIYETKNNNYWKKLADEINNYCEKNKIKYVNYFYHKLELYILHCNADMLHHLQ